jgi:hypothetical protein
MMSASMESKGSCNPNSINFKSLSLISKKVNNYDLWNSQEEKRFGSRGL